ncbi:MAG: potassium channel family protein [Candidatus Omnitrophota bacterium]
MSDKKTLEQEAHELLGEEKYAEAGERYLQAAKAFQRQDKHDRAAICLAASASSRALILGEKTYHRVAGLYEEAALEAEACKDLEYASMLYKYAAVAYERDHDNISLSECLFKSKEAYRRFLVQDLFRTKKTKENVAIGFNLAFFSKRIVPLLTLTFASLIWGHGERPHRTVGFGLVLILICAAGYMLGHLNKDGTIISPTFAQAFYFSFSSYTRVGVENITPVGGAKIVATIQAFIGIFTIPLYLTGLCRKYLRY